VNSDAQKQAYINQLENYVRQIDNLLKQKRELEGIAE
jgi:hypothetical protein